MGSEELKGNATNDNANDSNKPVSLQNVRAGEGNTDPATNQNGNAPGTNADERAVLKYSEDDVDKIVQKRLARERAKNERTTETKNRADSLDAREHMIEVRERKLAARDAVAEMGFEHIPDSVLKLLRYDTEEEYEQSLADVSEFVTALVDSFSKKSATGTTPKAYRQNHDPQADIRKAFGLK